VEGVEQSLIGRTFLFLVTGFTHNGVSNVDFFLVCFGHFFEDKVVRLWAWCDGEVQWEIQWF
jgi:hypothetical protein